MHKIMIAVGAFLLCTCCHAQHARTLFIKDAATLQPLPDVDIRVLPGSLRYTTDTSGKVSINWNGAGNLLLHYSLVGYDARTDSLQVSLMPDTLVVLLQKEEEEEEQEVFIRSTRSNRSIAHIPARVEFINDEELEEKANMRPGDIRMMLNESTGIQTQQVSATSASSSIRIQGLDGRYTQILKDGFPLYTGFSGGLGLLQTPPLDLQQVEIIKGAASTLYGGGAIAGLVNLISRFPTEERALRFLANATSAGGWDLSGFYSQRFRKTGWTILATRNTSKAYAPGHTVFTAIPQTERYVFNPKMFLYLDSSTTLSIGLNTVFENRTGGNIEVVKRAKDGYYEKNKTTRIGSQISLQRRISENRNWEIKNAVNAFDRKISIPGYHFNGRQGSTYTEASYNIQNGVSGYVAGVNLYTDHFRERNPVATKARDYSQTTFGAFVQHNHPLGERWQVEAGLRGDYSINYGLSVLPRLSIMWKMSPELTSRLGGGLGYKTPTIFVEDAERVQFRNLLPISPDSNRLERSYGLNWDFNYKTRLFDVFRLNVNQLFFYTRINHPLLIQPTPSSLLHLVNADGNLHSKGWETNLKLGWQDFNLYIGYTYTDAAINRNGTKSPNLLTAKTRLNNVLMYEVEDKWKIGLEAYYYSRQYLNDGTWGRSFWTFGFMAERKWGKVSAFINFENFTDTRQTKFGSIYTGTVAQPVFKDIYAPLDGRVINGGLKLQL